MPWSTRNKNKIKKPKKKQQQEYNKDVLIYKNKKISIEKKCNCHHSKSSFQFVDLIKLQKKNKKYKDNNNTIL